MKKQEEYIAETLEFIGQRGYSSNNELFLIEISKFLAELFSVKYVLVTKYSTKSPKILESVAYFGKQNYQKNIKYNIEGTPCEKVIDNKIQVYSNNLQSTFPKDSSLVQMNANSYIGIPLWSSLKEPIGLISILDNKSIEDSKTLEVILKIVSIKVEKILEKILYEDVLKLSNQKVRDSENKFKKLSDLSFEGILIHDNGIALDINQAFAKMFGYSRKELIGINVIDLLFQKKHHKVISKNKITSALYEIEGIKKNGIIFPIEVQAKKANSDQNSKVRVASIRDITKQRESENTNKKLSAAVEQSGNSIIITDINGKIEYTNPKFTKVTGYTAKEALGQNPNVLNSRTQTKEFYKELWQTITEGRIWKGQFKNKAKNGKLFWEQATITPVKNNEGEIINYLAIKEDITNRKKAEEDLNIAYETIKEKEDYLSTILKTAKEGFWIINKDTISLEVNREMCNILGCKEEDIIGKPIFDFVDKENSEIFLQEMKRRDIGLSTSYEISLLNKNGNNVPCLFNTSPMYDKEENRIGSFALVTNISKLKTAYNVLEDQNFKLKKLSFELSDKNRLYIESNQRFKSIFENSPVSLWEEDFTEVKELLLKKKSETSDLKKYLDENPDFLNHCISKIKIISVNKATLELLGVKDKAELITHLRKTNNAKSFKVIKKELLAFTYNKKEFRDETEFIRPDGKVISAIIKSSIDDDGKVIASIIDITALKKTKRELLYAKEQVEKSDERYALAVSATNLGIWDWDVTSNKVYYSKLWKAQLGYTENELDNKFDLWKDYLHPDDYEEKMLYFEKYFKNPEGQYISEFRLKHKNGSYIWMHSRAEVLKNEKGDVIRMFGTHRDITTLKNTQQELLEQNKQLIMAKEKAEESEELMKSITQSAADAIISINSKGLIMSWNEASKKIFGFTSLEMLNQKLNKIIPLRYLVKHETAINSIEQGGDEKLKSKPIEIFALRKDGTEFPVELSLTSWKMGSEKCFTGIIRDITDVKMANEKLILAKEKAEESDRLKTEFLNNMSHEIRTPMNGILGFTQMLSEPNLDPKRRTNFVNIIQNCGNQLLQIIDDILEISKLGTKQVKVIDEEVCLNDVLFELFSIFDVKAKENKTPLYLKKSLSDKKSTIITDKTKLNKILGNLIENALKFTSNGFIEFGYSLKNEKEQFLLEIYVKDTGIGIKEEYHKQIFERFAQAEKELAKKVGGLGLGLSIAKENTELIGGEIKVISENMNGSTFFITIPYKPVHDFEEDSIISDKLTVLIAEDEEVNYMYLETILNDKFQLNCDIFHAKNGDEAVQLCRDHSEIDFILMDLKMPVLNGFKATSEIREFRPNVPIIAQTAYSTTEDKEKALLAGCNDFISKPIDTNLLKSIIDKFLVKIE